MQYSCVTVHLTNKDKGLKGPENISERVKQLVGTLKDCDFRPSKISEHGYDESLTELEVEYHFDELDESAAKTKAEDIFRCIEHPLRNLHLIVSDISVVVNPM